MDTGKAILGVMAGIAAGAVIGILLAPEKGSDTRKILLGKGEDFAKDVNKKIDKKFDELMHTITAKFKFAQNDLVKPKKNKTAAS
ncbi:YtxH domain-containing protein [Fulvivirga sp. 29W222]|uniref:YtxH domain-containing protein n=1 Tax=Fulvivirga marina TaxID=2494733 RepID=A0A937G219_9BACT|nr:YtxH domain-containing protein [Fulvivirga marina]MBL6448761.1 YtxH domain-containing protein [Fulvivirga marina]